MTHRDARAESATCMLAVWAMGTRFELLLSGEDEGFLRAAGEAAIADIEDAHARLTAFSTDSVIASINASPPGHPVRIDGEMLELLQLAESIREDSGGVFDIAHASQGALPAITIDAPGACVARLHDGARLDLGSIDKGFALDLAAATLRDAGVASAFLQGGGSTSVAIGRRPDGERWTVELRPDGAAESIRIGIEDTAISISSNEARPHVVDPRKGSPADAACFAACIGSRAAKTDAWATAMLLSAFPNDELGSILWRPTGWTIRPDPLPHDIEMKTLPRTDTTRKTGRRHDHD